MKKKLLFVFNPKSGKGLIKEHLVNIVDIMTKAGYEITIYPTQCQGDAIKKVRKNAKKYDLVVCSGGDGTLDEVVTGMEQSDVNVPIGYIPAGSTNDFGKTDGGNDLAFYECSVLERVLSGNGSKYKTKQLSASDIHTADGSNIGLFQYEC